MEMAPAVADLMAVELGWNDSTKNRQLADFQSIAVNYVLAG